MSSIPTASLPLTSLLTQRQAQLESADTRDPSVKATKASASIDHEVKALDEFESIFISMLIKEMRKSAKDLFPGDSSDSLGVMFDMHIGSEIAKGGGLGIKQQLTRYLEAQRT